MEFPNDTSAATLLKNMYQTLAEMNPQQAPDSTTAAASILLNTPAECLVILFFEIMVHSYGFKLVAVNDANLSQEHGDKLSRDWNSRKDAYSFQFSHPQSSLTFMVKATVMGDQLLVHGMAIEDNKVHQLQLKTSSYISSTQHFPYTTTQHTIPTPTSQSITSNPLFKLFNQSENTIDELVTKFKNEIVVKFMPDLAKGVQTADNTGAGNVSRGIAVGEPSGIPRPGRPYVPAQEPPTFHPVNPLSVGDVDLDPFAASPGILPPHHGFPSTGPSGLGGIVGPGSGGGMFVGPDHPMFGGQGIRPEFPGPHGGNGRLPPGAIPPGARFDPIMPYGPRPGFRPTPGTFGGVPVPRPRPGQPGRNGQPFSGEPDNDELPPPGYGDMFM